MKRPKEDYLQILAEIEQELEGRFVEQAQRIYEQELIINDDVPSTWHDDEVAADLARELIRTKGGEMLAALTAVDKLAEVVEKIF